MEIAKKSFPAVQYYQQENSKKIIVLHHTVSGVGVDGDIKWWESTPEKVGTTFIIPREGGIVQLFDDKYWIHHLGIKQWMLNQFGSKVSNDRLNQLSIGIELDSWGGLVKRNSRWYNSAGGVVKPEDVQEYPNGFRGYFGFEKYTAKQIADLRQLLVYLIGKYQIPANYYPNMWEFNQQAVRGTHGIWTHVSFRPDKSDCHPQPELINMLKSLES